MVVTKAIKEDIYNNTSMSHEPLLLSCSTSSFLNILCSSYKWWMVSSIILNIDNAINPPSWGFPWPIKGVFSPTTSWPYSSYSLLGPNPLFVLPWWSRDWEKMFSNALFTMRLREIPLHIETQTIVYLPSSNVQSNCI